MATRVKAITGADPDSAERLLGELERAVERVAAGWDEDAGAEPAGDNGEGGADATAGSEGEPKAQAAPAASGQGAGATSAEAGRETAPAQSANGTDPGPEASGRRLNVDVGPFQDFSQLVRFEDAANAIGATEEISIRRFSAGRASIEVSLSEPVDLLRELESRCDLEFVVRHTEGEEIVLDVER